MILLLAACSGAPGPDSPGESARDSAPPDSTGTTSDTDSGDDSAGDTGPDTHPIPPGLEGLSEIGARNVVFVHVDTLRADRLPAYGSVHDTMPLSGDLPWLVVRDLYASTSWTVPSSVSLLTSLDVPHHGITHMLASREMNAAFDSPTIAGHLAAQGWRTVMMSGNQALPKVEGIFDEFEDVDPVVSGAYSTNLGWEVTDLLAWIDADTSGRPFFAVLQPMNVHTPYNPDDDALGTWSDPSNLPFSVDADEDTQIAQVRAAYAAAATDEERAALLEQVRDVYDEDVLGVDEGVHRLVEGLRERGLDRDTIVVLSGDHGETLFEEDNDAGQVFFGHGGKTRPELVHVPLLITHPGLPGGDVDCLAANVDVMPTLFRALGLPQMDGVDGVPLQDGCRDVVSAQTFLNDTDADALSEVLVTDGASALRYSCRGDTTRRYDLTVDPTGLDPVDEGDFPAEETLQAALSAEFAEVYEAFPDARCGGTAAR